MKPEGKRAKKPRRHRIGGSKLLLTPRYSFPKSAPSIMNAIVCCWGCPVILEEIRVFCLALLSNHSALPIFPIYFQSLSNPRDEHLAGWKRNERLMQTSQLFVNRKHLALENQNTQSPPRVQPDRTCPFTDSFTLQMSTRCLLRAALRPRRLGTSSSAGLEPSASCPLHCPTLRAPLILGDQSEGFVLHGLVLALQLGPTVGPRAVPLPALCGAE